MAERIEIGELSIDKVLYNFIKDEALPQTGVKDELFWTGFETIIKTLAPKNSAFLAHRDSLQEKLDTWYLSHQGTAFNQAEQQVFLKEIGYLVEEGDDFSIEPLHVDPEIANIAGPQLVVPADNARYALNAANARWGSLFDALYGTDMISNIAPYAKTSGYNPKRGEKVFAFVYNFLDEIAPLQEGSYAEVTQFSLVGGVLSARLASGQNTQLQNADSFVGYLGSNKAMSSILFKHNGLHVEVQIDKTHSIGATNALGMKDVIIESALSAIQDCEDSVAAVDAEDKVRIYRNWNGMMRGDLTATFENKGQTIYRTLNADKSFFAPDGGKIISLKGRTLLLIRNVGMQMYTDAVTLKDGTLIPEGFLDAMVTSLCAMHDLRRSDGIKNSTKGSIYIVKPKCHGRDEIAFMVELFGAVEKVLGLPDKTIKIGIMDEERRTTANLKETIRMAKERVFFINTGFLDRTGDEIHSVMELGAVLPKEEIKTQPWLKGYENQNVDVGLALGFRGFAQIGKGMWTMPDLMATMVETKIAHPLSGANTAWVPSPTAATLHALHYHKVNVASIQERLKNRPKASLNDILTPPMLTRTLTQEEIIKEVENNIQSILGYVVRWVDQGIGCSKVPDIHNVELMEDRATLRISSQHVANWLHHNIVSKDVVMEAFHKMAIVVDGQNAKDTHYRPMAPLYDESIAFQAALDLVFKGRNEPNGYTEFILHRRRREVKAKGF
ncbi:MAG: malate synthase G [Sulfurospirillaceae bacterium]|nr:malate synthase G [Sulfurospirillaceae bacterium]MDD2825401.1 malate synthase G [Sulfurospirillaceae bacterium]